MKKGTVLSGKDAATKLYRGDFSSAERSKDNTKGSTLGSPGQEGHLSPANNYFKQKDLFRFGEQDEGEQLNIPVEKGQKEYDTT
jgi:hypothetical protein